MFHPILSFHSYFLDFQGPMSQAQICMYRNTFEILRIASTDIWNLCFFFLSKLECMDAKLSLCYHLCFLLHDVFSGMEEE